MSQQLPKISKPPWKAKKRWLSWGSVCRCSLDPIAPLSNDLKLLQTIKDNYFILLLNYQYSVGCFKINSLSGLFSIKNNFAIREWDKAIAHIRHGSLYKYTSSPVKMYSPLPAAWDIKHIVAWFNRLYNLSSLASCRILIFPWNELKINSKRCP